MSWIWLRRADVDEIAEAANVSDEQGLTAALESAAKGEATGDADVFDLAGGYAAEILRRTPFGDRNPERAIAIAALFLERNGQVLTRSADVRSDFAAHLAAGNISETEIAIWFRQHSAPPPASFLVPEQDG